MELVHAFGTDRRIVLGLNMIFQGKVLSQGVLALAFLISLYGCVSLKTAVAREERIQLTSNQLHLLNGEFELLSVDSSYNMLDYCLLGKQKFDQINRPGATDRIRIEVLPKDQLKVALLHGEEVRKHKKIKGKLVDGYYVFKASQLLPLIAINVYGHQEVRLGLNTAQSLTVQLAGSTVVFIVFVPVTGGKQEEDYLVFRRK
ncbi:MAG: hypothetical protein WBP58_00200 [Chitinophagaceae bacterium]